MPQPNMVTRYEPAIEPQLRIWSPTNHEVTTTNWDLFVTVAESVPFADPDYLAGSDRGCRGTRSGCDFMLRSIIVDPWMCRHDSSLRDKHSELKSADSILRGPAN